MRSIEYLISTINQENENFIEKMNIKDDIVIINQTIKEEVKVIKKGEQTIKFISVNEKGLSKSRNRAIENANADICVISDDDFKYYSDASQKILEAYEKYKDADIIAFYYHTTGRQQKRFNNKTEKVNHLNSLKICSAQITFKRKAIEENNIRFNEDFGAGADKYNAGEENIFLYECLKKGLKVYIEPVYILEIEENQGSTWFEGYNKQFFETKGAVYYQMTPMFYWFLILQFAIRKRNLYKNDNISVLQAMIYMFKESKMYKRKIRKKVYMLGDVLSNTGPAIVNKKYYAYMQDFMFVCKSNNKIKRLLDLLLKIRQCDILLISGLSKFQLLGCKIGKRLNKKVIYLMHGYTKIEYEINEIAEKNRTLDKIEDEMLERADKIICVSKRFCEFLKIERPELRDKTDFVNNGINQNGILKKRNSNDIYTIISVGGGMKIKNNLVVCQSIERIKHIKIKFIVIGKLDKDGEKIRKYNFVEYYESLTHEDVLRKMRESDLYIQNSYFETFGLSVIEAIQQGCDILVSKNIGAIDVINNITQNEIIDDNKDTEEISKKIEKKYKDKNNNLGLKEEYSTKNSVKRLKKIFIK